MLGTPYVVGFNISYAIFQLEPKFMSLEGDARLTFVPPALSNVAVIYVLSEVVSPDVIQSKLKEWGLEGWDWHLQRLSDSKSVVVSPSKESINMDYACVSFTLPLNQIVISIKEADVGARPSGSISNVWVLLDDVPSGLCSSYFLITFGELMGKPLEVYPTSLDRLGLGRIHVWYLDWSRLLGSVEIFPLIKGFWICVLMEGQSAHVASPPPFPLLNHNAMLMDLTMVVEVGPSSCALNGRVLDLIFVACSSLVALLMARWPKVL
ncbi:hypothetical protein D1007_07447 [Hordeum vulgare]|nr:hypothetical protein D1007_07447 [Hordeum vulgare]